MYEIIINYCNNIKEGKIYIEPNKLNIKYGINGTGKTTVARAIKLSGNNNELQTLKSFFTDAPASVSVKPIFNKILVFDEEFVNQVVFRKDEVIENSFEVFLKTPNYDEKKEQLDKHLQSLRDTMNADKEIIDLKESLIKINDKFKRTNKGHLINSGALKSLLSKQNLYNIPRELEDYRTFFDNEDINIPWIDWRNSGDTYDISDNCPYCSEKIDAPKHTKQKEVFKRTYTKSDSKNLKEVLELLESIKLYIKADKYDELIQYVKTDTSPDIIKAIVEKLTTEFDLLISRFNAINEFGMKKIVIADITNLDEQINAMEFPKILFEIFGGEKIENIFERINNKVASLRKEAIILKREMGELKGLLQATIIESQNDINEFLKTAGISYELEIQAEDETNSRTILKQCFNGSKSDVSNIRSHLSWGEKNAFSLILFMYYSNFQGPDLIILDDPISSFDSNKKFAILHRMFKKNIGKKDVSFAAKSVLLLTHDFEPIIDFVVIGKISPDSVTASYIWNDDGNVYEKAINSNVDVKLVLTENKEIAKNAEINIISRIAALRKCCELNGYEEHWSYTYEILSCLIHGDEIRRKICSDKFECMPVDEIELGIRLIKEYIPDFDYEIIKNHKYTQAGIKELYKIEQNHYFKLQLFRAMCEICGKVRILPKDSAWYKFIDETYHIENDYLHYLDIQNFNIVPAYINKKVDELMGTL